MNTILKEFYKVDSRFQIKYFFAQKIKKSFIQNATGLNEKNFL